MVRKNNTKIVFYIFQGYVRGIVLEGLKEQRSTDFYKIDEDVNNLLLKISDELEFQGASSELLYLADAPHLHRFDFPGVSKKDFKHILENKVKSEVHDNSMYGFSVQNSKKENLNECLIHVIPQQIQIDFLEYSKQRSLDVQRIFTLSGLFSTLAKNFGKTKDGVTLVFKIRNKVLLLSLGNSEVHVVREIFFDVNEDNERERLLKEIQRTHLFIKQQYGFIPPKIIFFGKDLRDMATYCIDSIEETVELSAKNFSWYYWLNKMPLDSTENILPKDYLNKAKRLKRSRILSLINLTFLLITTITFWSIDRLVINTKNELSELNRDGRVSNLEMLEENLLRRLSEIEIENKVIKTKGEYTMGPLPGIILEGITTSISDSVVLNEHKMSSENGRWNIKLNGFGPRHALSSSKELENFTRLNFEGFSNYNLSVDWKQYWIETLKRGDTKIPEGLVRKFEIKGVAQ